MTSGDDSKMPSGTGANLSHPALMHNERPLKNAFTGLTLPDTGVAAGNVRVGPIPPDTIRGDVPNRQRRHDSPSQRLLQRNQTAEKLSSNAMVKTRFVQVRGHRYSP